MTEIIMSIAIGLLFICVVITPLVVWGRYSDRFISPCNKRRIRRIAEELLIGGFLLVLLFLGFMLVYGIGRGILESIR